MRASFEHLRVLVESVEAVPGDFAELGVWRGATFGPLALVGHVNDRICHAVDSFEGMSEPTAADFAADGTCQYKRGSLNAGGTLPLLEAIAAEFGDIQEDVANVRIRKGWVPEVLDTVKLTTGLAFTHVDLDQYEPTLHALRWAWERTNPGGILACHDWWPEVHIPPILATAALVVFMDEEHLEPTGRNAESGHIWFRKPAGETPCQEQPLST